MLISRDWRRSGGRRPPPRRIRGQRKGRRPKRRRRPPPRLARPLSCLTYWVFLRRRRTRRRPRSRTCRSCYSLPKREIRAHSSEHTLEMPELPSPSWCAFSASLWWSFWSSGGVSPSSSWSCGGRGRSPRPVLRRPPFASEVSAFASPAKTSSRRNTAWSSMDNCKWP